MSRNVIVPAVQVIVSGVVLFVLYRYLYDNLGIAQIGVWSLVLAATSVSRIGDLGLSAGMVRFVAQALGDGDEDRAIEVVQTVVLTLGVSMAVLLAAGYPFFLLLLGYLLPDDSIPIARDILPYSLISLWLMMIVGALSGALDGCFRLDLRSLIMAFSHLVFLGMTVWLVPVYGLLGVAISQLIQAGGLLVLLWWVLKRQLTKLPTIPRRWKYLVLKDMFHYGVNFQVITLMNMLFDPVIKVLMSKFGGLDSLGFYEMANGLVTKCRAIIIEANRVMVPSVAKLGSCSVEKVGSMFAIAYRQNFYGSIFFYGMLGIFTTTISIIWLGHYHSFFVQYVLLLNAGWFINTIIGPAYFSNLGAGNLKPNMMAHAIMGLFSLAFGGGLGMLYGGVGVVLGAVTGLFAGSVFLLVEYTKRAGGRWSEIIIPSGMLGLLLVAVIMIALANSIHGASLDLILAFGIALLCASTFAIFIYRHPDRDVLMGLK